MPEMTHDDLMQHFNLMFTEPHRYLALVQEFIRQHPESADGYFSRHQVWEELGRYELALEDLNRSLSLEEHWIVSMVRGCIHRQLGDYAAALCDYDRAAVLDREEWLGSPGPLFRADCHARLGNETAALADCALLPDNHWTPGLSGAPAGTKADVIAAVRYLAAVARQQRSR